MSAEIAVSANSHSPAHGYIKQGQINFYRLQFSVVRPKHSCDESMAASFVQKFLFSDCANGPPDEGGGPGNHSYNTLKGKAMNIAPSSGGGFAVEMGALMSRWSRMWPLFKAKLSTFNRRIDSRTGRLLLLAAVIIAYLLAYLGDPMLPGNEPRMPRGWWGLSDQGLYLASAESLAHLHLTPDTYAYPLGYPAMGALFYWFAPQHAFLVPNLFCTVGIVCLFYLIAIRFVSPLEAVLLTVWLAIAYRGTVAGTLVMPWNSIPTHFLAYAVILLIGLGPPTLGRVFTAAGCVAVVYLCRTGDALCLAFPLGIAILQLPGTKQKVLVGLGVGGILFTIFATVLSINHSVFGSWQTSYEKLVSRFGFGSYSLSQKFFMMFVDGTPVFHEKDTAILQHFPWLLLIVPGAVHLVHRYKAPVLGASLAVCATYVLHVGYNGGLWPLNIYRFFLIHYVFWTIPVLALVTYIGLREAWKHRLGRWSFCSVPVLLMLVSNLSLRERQTSDVSFPASTHLSIPASEKDPHDWIEFIGVEEGPKLSTRAGRLDDPHDHLLMPQFGKIVVMLSRHVRSTALFAETEHAELQHVRAGTLAWRIRSIPRFLIPVLANRFAEPVVLPRGKTDKIDLAGPLGVPDNEPDEVVQVSIKPWLRPYIAVWEIETDYHDRHWISASNPQGWWIIKTEVQDTETAGGSYSQIKLCFPDFGDFEQAPTFRIKATDSRGNLVWERTIQKDH